MLQCEIQRNNVLKRSDREMDFVCLKLNELHIPGLWSLFSKEPILDLAFQFNLVLIICKFENENEH